MENKNSLVPSEQMLLQAKLYRNAGLSVIPISSGSKKPATSWKRYQSELIDETELERLYRTPHNEKLPDRIAVIGGPVSGGLEMLDFDFGGVEFEPWKDRIPRELYDRLVIERTPSEGYHVAYRCEKNEGNQVLCQRHISCDGKQQFVAKASIETRGVGGYCVVAPSDNYRIIQGNWTDLPLISSEERDILFDAARSLNQITPLEKLSSDNIIFTNDNISSERPGEIFNSDSKTPQKIFETLLRHGWTLDHETDQQWFLKHPGNRSKEHSTTLSKSNGFLHTFSPNTVFEQGKNISPFETYALLETNGDFTLAAAQLGKAGYAVPIPQADLSGILNGTAFKTVSISSKVIGTKNIIPGIEALGKFCSDLYSGKTPLIWDVGLGSLSHIELSPNRIVVFGGAPGSGKTALTMQLVFDALAINSDLRLVIANVEMTPSVLLERQVARFSGVSLGTIQMRNFTTEQKSMIDAGIHNIEALAPRITFIVPPIDLQIVNETLAGYGGDIVVLDYLQRIPVHRDNQHKELRVEMNRVMDSIRVTSNTGRCVIGLSSLNRAVGKEGYDANNLTLSSFKESGEIEYGADDCFGVCFGKHHASGKLLVPVKHLKSRHHERMDFELLFDGALQSFCTVDTLC